jgi:hypothetical protein
MQYVRCIDNRGYQASLTVGATYKILANGEPDSLRVVDNEGEDYLYDAQRFQIVELNNQQPIDETVTIHINSQIKGILRAEALAAQTNVSALLREWIEDRLDLPLA